MFLEELIVIFSCVKSVGCKETSSLYYGRHPEINQMENFNKEKVAKIVDPIRKEAEKFVKPIEKKINEFLNPTFIAVIGPIITISSGGTSTIPIDKNYSAQLNSGGISILFKKEF